MNYFTGTQLESRVRTDLDLLDEPAVSQAEILNYINEAVDIAEANIHTLYEDYFLNKAALSLVAGTQEYSLPSDIYSDKIRAIVYHNGTEIYQVKRIRGMNVFRDLKDIDQFGSADRYRYILYNASAAAGVKISLYPTSRETSSTVMTIWYIRNATRLSAIGDTCDIPEWTPFIVSYVKMKCIMKLRDRDPQMYISEMENLKMEMITALENRVPDDDDKIPMDMDHYFEHE